MIKRFLVLLLFSTLQPFNLIMTMEAGKPSPDKEEEEVIQSPGVKRELSSDEEDANQAPLKKQKIKPGKEEDSERLENLNAASSAHNVIIPRELQPEAFAALPAKEQYLKLHHLCSAGNIDLVRHILSQIDLELVIHSNLLLAATRKGNMSTIKTFIVAMQHLVSEYQNASNEKAVVYQMALKSMINTVVKSADGSLETPLSFLLSEDNSKKPGFMSCVRLLIQAGADVELPLQADIPEQLTTLSLASRLGYGPLVSMLLEPLKGNSEKLNRVLYPSIEETGEDPLTTLFSYCSDTKLLEKYTYNTSLLKALIQAGYDVNHTYEDGQTVLLKAKNDAEHIFFLWQHGAELFDIKEEEKNGKKKIVSIKTPLLPALFELEYEGGDPVESLTAENFLPLAYILYGKKLFTAKLHEWGSTSTYGPKCAEDVTFLVNLVEAKYENELHPKLLQLFIYDTYKKKRPFSLDDYRETFYHAGYDQANDCLQRLDIQPSMQLPNLTKTLRNRELGLKKLR